MRQQAAENLVLGEASLSNMTSVSSGMNEGSPAGGEAKGADEGGGRAEGATPRNCSQARGLSGKRFESSSRETA